MKKLIITIDGPAGAGKSTLAKELARRLNYLYLDTGAIYRALAWKALQEKVDLGDEESLVQLAKKTRIELKCGCKTPRIYVDGKDVSEEIRLPHMGEAASQVSAFPGVRREVLRLQRKIGEGGGVVAEGRDTGTVIFPQADKKFYLDASVEERAKRRWKELREKGHSIPLEEVRKELSIRDERDKNRKVAPLKAAPDAVVINSTHLSVGEELDLVLGYLDNQG